MTKKKEPLVLEDVEESEPVPKRHETLAGYIITLENSGVINCVYQHELATVTNELNTATAAERAAYAAWEYYVNMGTRIHVLEHVMLTMCEVTRVVDEVAGRVYVEHRVLERRRGDKT